MHSRGGDRLGEGEAVDGDANTEVFQVFSTAFRACSRSSFVPLRR